MRVEHGSYASDLLLASHLDSRDAGLASEIVFGVLRYQGQLDYLIRHFSGRAAKLDPEVRIALRMGVYQLRFLDRIPRHAAVTEAVELVKRAKKRSATGFVNAVLRKTDRSAVQFPDRPTALSQPAWLLDQWDREFGVETADLIALEFLKAPQSYIRNPPEDRGLVLEGTDVPGGYRVVSGDTTGLRLQDIGSQSLIPLMNLKPGLSFLDLCAAPGSKTAHALEFGVRAVACDIHLHRLRQMQGCDRVLLDARQPLPFRQKFDRILLDAPCSGTGTLGRNPEIRWRLQPSDLKELATKQAAILTQALGFLAPGGILLYSTCSLERQENEDVVDQVLTGNLRYSVSETRRRTPGIHSGDGFFSAVITSIGAAND